MKYREIITVLLVCLLLTGCAGNVAETPPVTTTEPPATEAVATEPPPTEPITVYEGAIEDYLGEITDFSWPQEYKPEFVMIHFCSAVVNHPDDPYNMDYIRQTFIDADVSIHYVIARDGTIHCYIPEDRTAWHAGYGEWLGEEKYKNNLNRYSIGIELAGMGTQEEMSLYLTKKQYEALKPEWIGYTDEQYAALAGLVADICKRHEIPLDRDHIIGHDEFSPKKNDPGELFDWSRIIPGL